MARQTTSSSFSKWVSLQKDAESEDRPQNRHWPHSPESLARGSVVYTVKYYGVQVVEEAKGVAPVKDAIRRMKFHKQLRKSEGHKTTPKVELCITVDGLTIQDIKSKMEMHRFHLHHISYCAEDKGEKKLFTFIARDTVKSENLCFVLGSDKCAQEIVFTIGQSFDLAYKRFLEKSGKEMDAQKQFLLLQKQVRELQSQNSELKKRVAELEAEKSYGLSLASGAQNAGMLNGHDQPTSSSTNGVGNLLDTSLPNGHSMTESASATQATATDSGKENGDFLHGIVLASPPPVKPRHNVNMNPLMTASAPAFLSSHYGATSPPISKDVFGMDQFTPVKVDSELMKVTEQLDDLQTSFSRGLVVGAEHLTLDSFDPLVDSSTA